MATLLVRTIRSQQFCVTGPHKHLQRLCSQKTPLRWRSSQATRAATGKLGSFQVSASQRVDITSPGNDHVKHCHKLRTSSQYRNACGRVLLVGSDLLQEVVLYERPEGPINVHSLLVRNRCKPPAGIAADRISVVTDEIMNKICGLQNSDGVQAVAEFDMPKFANLSDANSTSLQRLLVLERLQDPGNLGTLLRTAVALGWDACFLLPGCCDPFNDKALKAGRGAAFKLPIVQGNWDELLRVMHRHNMQCYGASPERSDKAACAQQSVAENVLCSRQPSDLPQGSAEEAQDEVTGLNAMCIVLGSEGQGLSKTALEHSTPLAIPMTGHMESLNVSQAGAILMFAFCGNSLKLYDQVKRPR